ncbi:DUF1971 domain-containing protein [Hyphomicrobium sp.]|uniref:DUF1971 domain-containing protein n=1 Tax=Hyphomicrobium sp. TaxID=82 RepID=UPI002E337679|nr:DUF1971 domain-containing protein [Hyphomicrobium sp.]HEX2843354.1 DUF1971 domain-containing protein [Hyphomicrobium sp.]
MADAIRPYRSTAVFDEVTLPNALCKRHSTKAGVWGVIRVLEGRLRLTYLEPASEKIIDPDNAGLLLPEQPHFVTPIGPMTMQIDFYDRPPEMAR